MTTVELAQRLLVDLDVQDVSLATANTRAALIDAINTAIQKAHIAGPNHWRQVVSSAHIKAPEIVTLTVEKGSNQYSGWTAPEDALYCSLRIDGDTVLHQIVGGGELMDVYTGESGTVQATLYYDALAIYPPIERLVTDPYLLDTGQQLRRLPESDVNDNLADVCRLSKNRHVGMPREYAVEPNAFNEGSECVFVLRFAELPGADYRMRVKVQMSPLKLKFEDLIVPKNLPVRDDLIEAYIKPMARALMTTNSLWKDDSTKVQVREEAAKAESALHVFSQDTMAARSNRVGTPHGY